MPEGWYWVRLRIRGDEFSALFRGIPHEQWKDVEVGPRIEVKWD